MKRALGPSSQRTEAWGHLVANLAVLPGLGSLMAGRRITGWFQILISLLGLGLSCWFAYATLHDWWVRREVVLPEGRVLLMGVAGIGCFGVAWLWALATSLAVLRASADTGETPGGAPGI